MPTLIILQLFLLFNLFEKSQGTPTQEFAQSKSTYKILNIWLQAHNSGKEAEIESFIKSSYSSELLEKIDIDKHIEFYSVAYDDFGELDDQPYKVIKEDVQNLTVQLLKKGYYVIGEPDPKKVFEIEINLSNSENKLKKGLGIGPLVCKPEYRD